MKQRNTAVAKLGVAAALGAGLLLAPVTVAHAEDPTPGSPVAGACEITDGTMSWGLLERWRAYISGVIAKGNYEPIAPASYEVPNFNWSNPTGSVDADTGAGEISFEGGVHFTGHNGALDTSITNPTIAVAADGSAQIRVDVNSLGRDGAPDTVDTQVPLAELGVIGPIDTAAGSFAVEGAPSTLTEAGSAVFTYEAGQEMDPITFAFSFDCVTAAEEDDAVTEEPEEAIVATPISAPVAESSVPWVPIIIGGVVVIVAAVVVGAVVASRKKKAAGAGTGTGTDAGSGDASGDGGTPL